MEQKKNDKVWSVTIDIVTDGDRVSYNTELYRMYENAKAAFDKKVESEKKECSDLGYDIMEVSDTSFESYIEGYESQDHSYVTLEQVEFMDW